MPGACVLHASVLYCPVTCNPRHAAWDPRRRRVTTWCRTGVIHAMGASCASFVPERRVRWQLSGLIRTSNYDKHSASTKNLHTWIILVIVKQHLVQIGRIDAPTEYSSLALSDTKVYAP